MASTTSEPISETPEELIGNGPKMPTQEQFFDIRDPSEDDAKAIEEKARVEEEVAAEASKDAATEAIMLGMTAEEAATFKDGAALATAISVLKRMRAQGTDAEAALAEAAGGTSTDAGEDPGLAKELDEIEAIEPDDQVDPEMARRLKVLAKALRGSVRPKQEPKAVDDGSLDYHIAALGDDFADLFGKGDAKSMAERSPQRVQRRLVVEETERIIERARQQKRTVPSRESAFQQALRTLHAEKVRLAEQRRADAKAEARKGQFIGRPGGSSEVLAPGRAKAINGVRAKLAELAER